jgi:hypothetical protein
MYLNLLHNFVIYKKHQGCGTGKFEYGSGPGSDILPDFGSGSGSGPGGVAGSRGGDDVSDNGGKYGYKGGEGSAADCGGGKLSGGREAGRDPTLLHRLDAAPHHSAPSLSSASGELIGGVDGEAGTAWWGEGRGCGGCDGVTDGYTCEACGGASFACLDSDGQAVAAASNSLHCFTSDR